MAAIPLMLAADAAEGLQSVLWRRPERQAPAAALTSTAPLAAGELGAADASEPTLA
jgi:hypothetical protein